MTDLMRAAAQQALEQVQEFKRRWWLVPALGNKVNKATRVAITNAHSHIFELEHALRAALAAAPQAEPVQEFASIPGTNVRVRLPVQEPAQEPVQEQRERELNEALTERDDAEDYIDALLDEVLGPDRAEWSSAYGRADALEEVRERIAQMLKPSIDKARNRFEAALEQQAQPVQEPGFWGRDPLEAALAAAPQAEPVARVELMTTGGNAGLATRIVEIDDHLRRERLRPGQLLYTVPPALAAPQWIACEERLPEAGVEVLVWLAAPVIKYGCQIAIDTWDEQHETPVAWSSATIPIGEGWDSGADWQDITHWMPLPAAPRSER